MGLVLAKTFDGE